MEVTVRLKRYTTPSMSQYAISWFAGTEAVITAEVNPDLVGGFIFDLGDEMLDASVASALDKIRRSLIEKNRRIV